MNPRFQNTSQSYSTLLSILTNSLLTKQTSLPDALKHAFDLSKANILWPAQNLPKKGQNHASKGVEALAMPYYYFYLGFFGLKVLERVQKWNLIDPIKFGVLEKGPNNSLKPALKGILLTLLRLTPKTNLIDPIKSKTLAW